MERIRGDRGRFRVCQPAENVARFARGEYPCAMGLDVIPKPSRQDVCGKVGFQLALADKKYDGMKIGFREVEEFFKRLRVAVILVKRVLELILLPVDRLRPFRGPLAAEDPSAHVFRLNHENSKY